MEKRVVVFRPKQIVDSDRKKLDKFDFLYCSQILADTQGDYSENHYVILHKRLGAICRQILQITDDIIYCREGIYELEEVKRIFEIKTVLKIFN